MQCSNLLSLEVHCSFPHSFLSQKAMSSCQYVFCYLEEVGIEKKIIASVSPDNSDVQYQFMLEQRVLQRLCVQKILVPTPMKDKLEKVM
jgi:hypothetical protein